MGSAQPLAAVSNQPLLTINPRRVVCLQGVPINYCPTVDGDPKDCDAALAATLYCYRLGYAMSGQAVLYKGPKPVKETVALALMLDGKQRPPWNTTGGVMEKCETKGNKTCYTFESLHCVDTKFFLAPKVDGIPLDWCTDQNRTADCGKAAARAFCNNNGFDQAESWNGPIPTKEFPSYTWVGFGNNTDTVTAAGKKACDSKKGECNTFLSINCGG
jgi:hypothetical protein